MKIQILLTTILLGIIPYVQGQVDPKVQRFVEKTSQKVVFRENTFYPKTEVAGKNFFRGNWFDALPLQEKIWDPDNTFLNTFSNWSALNTEIPGSVFFVQGLPSLRIDILLNSPQKKAQFFEDFFEGKVPNEKLATGPPAGPITGITNILKEDRALAKSVFLRAFRQQEAGTMPTSFLTTPIFTAGYENLDLRGTGITESRFLEAFPIGSATTVNAIPYLTFDEEE